MPIAKAIKECRFPYSANHKSMQMDRPPGTPALSFVGTEVAQLFEAAFSQTGIKGGRPTARHWATLLQKLEANTKQCANNKGHYYPSHVSAEAAQTHARIVALRQNMRPQMACPWCQMEAQGANALFPFVFPGALSGATVDVEALWRQLQGLDNLGPAPLIPMPSARPRPAARQVDG